MGYAAYSALHEQTTNCLNQPALLGNVKEIDAFLFADNEVTGMILYDAFKINGGVITPYFTLLGALNASCPIQNEVNYDYRVLEGMPLLKQLGDHFTKIEVKK